MSAPGGFSALGGVCSRGDVCSGGVYIPACTEADPPVNRITDTCKNITLPNFVAEGNKYSQMAKFGFKFKYFQFSLHIFVTSSAVKQQDFTPSIESTNQERLSAS